MITRVQQPIPRRTFRLQHTQHTLPEVSCRVGASSCAADPLPHASSTARLAPHVLHHLPRPEVVSHIQQIWHP
jgi:hypothetical protein